MSSTLGGDKVSMLTYTYTQPPRKKIKVAIWNHQVDRPLYAWPDIWSGNVQV